MIGFRQSLYVTVFWKASDHIERSEHAPTSELLVFVLFFPVFFFIFANISVANITRNSAQKHCSIWVEYSFPRPTLVWWLQFSILKDMILYIKTYLCVKYFSCRWLVKPNIQCGTFVVVVINRTKITRHSVWYSHIAMTSSGRMF